MLYLTRTCDTAFLAQLTSLFHVRLVLVNLNTINGTYMDIGLEERRTQEWILAEG